jgi:hypothetical protein
MPRVLYIGLLAIALPTVQAGCCCCRLPAQMVRLGAVNAVRNAQAPQPPVVEEQPPVQAPPPPFIPPVNPPINPPKQPFPPPPGNQRFIYRYSQNTGQLKFGDQLTGTGFSGKGAARNNPESYKERLVGIIPVGDWKVERRRIDPKTGQPVIDLSLFTGGHVAGRTPVGENFTIHPDNGPNAGESGIAMPVNAINAIQVQNGVQTLIEVRNEKAMVPQPPPPPAPGAAKTYTYRQSTGELKLDNEVLGKGFSGVGEGKNNGAMQGEKNVGPIPVGDYRIARGTVPGKAGQTVVRLLPVPGTDTLKRYPKERFMIVPEPGNNQACELVLPRAVYDRIEVRANPSNQLKVVP